MNKRVAISVLLVIGALGVPVLAGTFTMHPAGFGQHSYASWKAQEGIDDSSPRGLPQQAVYFQKFTDTTQNAAGVVVFKGFAGLEVNQIEGLEWKHRDDGWCGAGAPRWNIVSEDASGKKFITFLGCAESVHQTNAAASMNKSGPHTWTRDIQPAPAAQECRELGPPFMTFPPGFCADFTVTQLAIVFDEGTTLNGLPLGPGFVYLDDITVTADGVTHVWQSASDNGNNSTAFTPILGVSAADADELVPASQILADLLVLFPGVPLTSFMLYPDVLP